MNTEQKTAILFGGTGFIGSYLAVELLDQQVVDSVVLADLVLDRKEWPQALKAYDTNGKVTLIASDVRKEIDASLFPSTAEVIVNLAAVHREPGHAAEEYFETNLPGAEHVCAFAEKIQCNNIIFTSSIAVYGASEAVQETKSEETLPKPNTPYGISKLVAEKMHIAWQRAANNRRLLIVRPGVIYGAGEKGNVTRMVRAIINRYFAYTGNQNTRKAGGYVRELCKAIVWMYVSQQEKPQTTIFNFTIDPAPTVEEYAVAIKRTAHKDVNIWNIPFSALLIASYIIAGAFALIGKQSSINPTRVRKTRRSNYIIPGELTRRGYTYSYSLLDAMQDWKRERPEDWR